MLIAVNILAIGSHWDDIELGCSLTLKKLKEKGHEIFTVVVCSSQYGKNEDEGMKEDDALECGLKSFDIIGANYIPTEKESNSQLVYNKKIMQDMEIIASNKKIDCVFTHWFGVRTWSNDFRSWYINATILLLNENIRWVTPVHSNCCVLVAIVF